LPADFTTRSISSSVRTTASNQKLCRREGGNRTISEVLILDMILTSCATPRVQTNIDGFTVMVKKSLPVTKASLKKFCLEFIIDADLVSLSSYFQDSIELSFSVLPFHGLAVLLSSITFHFTQAD